MKLCNLFFCFLMLVSFATTDAQKEGQEWEKGAYAEILATSPKLYVYPDGRYLITKKPQTEGEKVAFAVVLYQKDIGKVKPEGKLSEKFVDQYLQNIEPFDPGKAMMGLPCCHIYDKNGRIVSSYYPPNSCPIDCKIPIRRGGKTFQLDCCPPQAMHRNLMANLQLQPR